MKQVRAMAMFCMLLSIRHGTRAEPIVLYEGSNTRPIEDYLFRPDTQALQEQLRQIAYVKPDPNKLRASLFPVRTPEMTPGEVQAREVDLPQLNERPLFLIGSDAYSKDWLRFYASKLHTIGAFGMVVEVETENDFEELERIGAGLELAPISGSQLAKALKLTHYPVLIGAERIEQ